MSNPVDISAWGENPPEFVQILASIVEEAGNNTQAGKKLGIDRSSVSTLLRNDYRANTKEMEAKILAFAHGKRCPILGQISAEECQKNRELPFISTNQRRVILYRACRQCKHNPNRGEA